MTNLQILLSLTLAAFLWTPKPVDNEKPRRLDDLPIKCWEKIFSFDESGFDEHCASACFKISVMKDAYDYAFVTNEMIDRCRLAGRKDRHGLHSFFSLFSEKERGKICSKLEKRIKLMKQIADLGLLYKYKGRKPPKGSDDFKKLKLSESYRRMYKSILSKEELYGLKQIELLRHYGINIGPSDTETDSTASTGTPNGSQHDSDSD